MPPYPGRHRQTTAGVEASASRLEIFAAAILDADAAVPPGLHGPDGLPSARRFAVYRNNVIVGLIEALRAAYPVVCRLVGDEFFTVMARDHARQSPPVTPVMLDYGAGFADFIAGFNPAAELIYLPDVARLERAWLEAYHAAEATPLDAARLAAIPPESLPELCFIPHPSLRILRSRHPVASIWHVNIEGGAPAVIDIAQGGEDVLVVRPAADVRVHVLPSGAASFVMALVAGASVLTATGSALADDPCFDLGRTLAGLLETGALCGLDGEAVAGTI